MNAAVQHTTLATMRQKPEQAIVSIGFDTSQSFELMQRAAKLLSSSTLVPAAYRSVIEKLDKFGNVKERIENPNALANSVIALNMAHRMSADPLMVMQNLYIVEGRPSWSSQWIIAAINGCGRFSPLRFDIKALGQKEVERTETYWENSQRNTRTIKVKITDKVCTAWAIEKETGERIESPAVSIEMAVKEGWYTKNGSKWQTMDEVMLRYRTASFFGKLYAPELLMGLQTVEEAHDIIDLNPDGTIASVMHDNVRNARQPKDITSPQNPSVDVAAEESEVIDTETGEIITVEQTVVQPASEAATEGDPVLANIEQPSQPRSRRERSATAGIE
ncbi:MAG: hypothetical protein LBI35_05120 [Burkholderiales bacterium]|nr:hypothetical protein [Burkholderiales bacterium]